MPGKVTRVIRKGETFRYDQAGAGGWGNPLERDAGQVLWDVRNEYVSLEMARAVYGVVVDPRAWIVNEAMTSKLRREMRKRRGTAAPSFVDRGELPPSVARERQEHLCGKSRPRVR
jgi:N-methylhydantoinase B/oxoprolinase/acetone carboxylase alpha subunit